MISQEELKKLVEPWPVDYTPQYRKFTCAKCGRELDLAWHCHFVNGVKREIHLCGGCGADYGMFVDKKTLVVVATHNGKKFLEKLLPTIKYPYLVIDTGSTEQESIDYFDSLLCAKARINGGYCISAYEYAYRNYEFEEYFFMHDSMIVKNVDFVDRFREKGDAVAWLHFYFAPEHGRDYLAKFPGESDPTWAIFGPIFYAKRTAMDKLNEMKLFPPKPKNRDEAVAAESGYGLAFHRAGINVDCVEEMDNERIDDKRDYKLFDKLRPSRQ
jgi:hypothetical protein